MNNMRIRRMIENASEDMAIQDKLIALVSEVMDKLKMIDPEEYKKIEKKLYDNGMKNGGKHMFDKEMAEYIVNQLYEQNNIKQSERMFNLQKVEQLVQKHNIPLKDFTVEDFYITLVMAQTDFKDLLGTNMDNYVTYAKLWLMDKDAPMGGSQKLCDYLTYVSQIMDDEPSYDNGYNYPYMSYIMPYDNRGNMNRGMSRRYDNRMNGNYDNRMNGNYDNRSRMRYDNRKGEYSIRGNYDNGNGMYNDNGDMDMMNDYDERSRSMNQGSRYNGRY